MQTLVEITAGRGAGGAMRVLRCHGRPPLTPRLTGSDRVHLVGTGGGPLPGDVVRIDVSVGPGARLELASVAATIAQRGDLDAPDSRWDLRVRVADGATLVAPGAPLVAAVGCRHRVNVSIDLEGDARLAWGDLLVAGRTDEPCGDASTSLVVRRDGAALLEQELSVGPRSPGWAGGAVFGGARCVGNLLLAGPAEWRPDTAIRIGKGAILMPLAAPGAALATAVGDPGNVTRALAAVSATIAW